MKFAKGYRLLAGLAGPRIRAVNGCGGAFAADGPLRKDTLRLLRNGRCLGAAVCLFGRTGITGTLFAGSGGESGPVIPGMYFRLASVTKMVTAAVAAGLAADGIADPDRDIGDYLGVRVRAPGFDDTPVTLAMLLNHTASVRDSDLLFRAEKGLPLEAALKEMRFTGARPGEAFAYSNEGAALAGAVLEAASGKDLDTLLEEEFGPCGTYFPSRLPADTALSDAVRILPRRTTAWSGAAHARETPEKTGADPRRHYGRAHGSLCMKSEALAKVTWRIMTEDRYGAMRRPAVPFGERDPRITEGSGMFIVRGDQVPGGEALGHQGLAYGAAHGVFYRPDTQKGFVLLTSGCSLARRYVLTDLNLAAMAFFLGDEKT